MLLSIRHTSHYTFSEPVHHGMQRLRLTPKVTAGQSIRNWKIELEGASLQAEYDDQNHNHVSLVAVDEGVSSVLITSSGRVDTADTSGVIGQHAGFLPLWYFLQQTPITRPGNKMQAIADAITEQHDERLPRLHALSALLHDQVRYEIGRTSIATTAEQAIMAGHGVCQDHAHLFIGCARAMGIPTRYISGYLMMNDRVDQEASHAWAEAHVDGLGWVGFDVSNGISPDPRYVRVATGRDYAEAAPITGMSWGAKDRSLQVKVAVEQQFSDQ